MPFKLFEDFENRGKANGWPIRQAQGRLSVGFAFALILFLYCASAALGDDDQRIAPKLPPANPPAKFTPPAAASRSAGDQQILPKLKGLLFVDSPNKLRSNPNIRQIETGLAPLLDSSGFRQRVSGFLGKPVTITSLDEICQIVVIYCRSIDRPVVDAIVPEQDVTSGVIQIVVLEGRVGQVRAEGNRYFSNHLLTSAVRARPGDVISQNQLLEDVDWLNRNPFRQTDLIFERGTELGQTDVVLHTEDHFPLRVYTGYENTGTPATGEDRYLAGFNWGNAFGLDDQLNYQYTMNRQSSRFEAHSGSYVAPLPWRHILTLFGNWSASDIQSDPNVLQHGESWQLSARYEIPMPKYHEIASSFILGGDFKRSNTNAEFGGESVFASNADVAQFMLGYNASRADAYGSTDASLEWYISPGGFDSDNTRPNFQSARAGASPDYTYAHLTLNRLTNLPDQFSWLSRFQGQIASGPLLGSEQLGVGGLDSVRGYLEREGNGDDGLIFSNELHTPPVSFLNIAGHRDQLSFLGFLDYGVAWTRDPQPGQLRQENFLGAGPGISYRLGPWLSVDYAYGWRITEGDPTVNAAGRSHLRVIASFTY